MDLLTAVKVESSEKVKEIVKKQAITSDSSWMDYIILNTALEHGKEDLAEFLLDQNCRVNTCKKSPLPVKHTTPLHHAVRLGNEHIVEKLLKKHASVLASDSEDNSPLHLAFIQKRETIVDLLLSNVQKDSNHINLKNKHGLSHLHIACTAKDGQVIQGFLDAGGNIDDEVNDKKSPWAGFNTVHFAVNFKCLEALKILLKLGAKHESKTSKGKTPLSLANQHIEDWLIMIDLLKEKSSNEETRTSLSNFHVACLRENERMVKNFISHGVKVNSVTPLGLTVCPHDSPLHCAVASGCKKKVELLLKHGAQLDIINVDAMTPLHLAVYNESYGDDDKGELDGIVDLLYNSVSDKMVDCVDTYKLSYFHVAITRNDLATVKKYLDNDNTIVNKKILDNIFNFSNFTSLHFAIDYQHKDIVELLLEHGADVNVSDEIKCGTPLHMAFEHGDIDLIELLLKNDAAVNALTPVKHKTMLHLLVDHCCINEFPAKNDQLYKNEDAILMYVEQLVKLGVDVNAKDSDGNTALHLIDLAEDNAHKYFQLLVDLGADVNLENNEKQLPFDLDNYLIENCNCDGYMTFYHHVQKLKPLGLKVHSKVEECCKKILEEGNLGDEELSVKQKQRNDEIAKLKNVKIGEATTLCDFLKLDLNRAALFAKCKTLKKLAKDDDLKHRFPLYGYLVKLQYDLAVNYSKQGKSLPNIVELMCNDESFL